ncbi:MAG: hypothetical protein Q8M98_00610 [Candidatus Cloacimonadaceae bacterium]|nr:hypothetical protein [Candidatus Cloacimonadaceae bacterium]
MTSRDLVLNFVKQFRKPFTAQTLASMTALDTSVVEPVLIELLEAGTIKLKSHQEGIYVLANRYNPKVCYNQKGDWKFDPAAANALLDLIEKGKYTSVRTISKDFGLSRQWVFVYLEAMASMGLIGLKGDIYVVITRENIRDIGKKVIPGALGTLRPKLSEEVKLRRAEEKEARHRIWLQQQAERIEKRKHAEAEKAESEAHIQAWNEYRKSKLYAFQDFNTYLKNRNRT